MLIREFWRWYERNYKLNLGIAAGLFLLQIIHLFWLFGEVVTMKLFGSPLFILHDAPKLIIILVDYTEIPALFAVSGVYINELRKSWQWKSALYLFFINSQWLHLFWITDEFILKTITDASLVSLPLWFAWVAIAIDYLELPVIYDTLKRFRASLKKQDLVTALAKIKEE
ncbi:MAG: hypothetical protein AAB392_02980 [Patescibacteria group bacterium]